jgi:hypothetical protein
MTIAPMDNEVDADLRDLDGIEVALRLRRVAPDVRNDSLQR